MHRGQRRVTQAAWENVIEPDHGNFIGHLHARPAERLQDADRHLIVGADDGVGKGAGRQQLLASYFAAGHAELTLSTADKLALRVAPQRLHEATAPLHRVRRAAWPVHVVDPAPVMRLDQVRH